MRNEMERLTFFTSESCNRYALVVGNACRNEGKKESKKGKKESGAGKGSERKGGVKRVGEGAKEGVKRREGTSVMVRK